MSTHSCRDLQAMSRRDILEFARAEKEKADAMIQTYSFPLLDHAKEDSAAGATLLVAAIELLRDGPDTITCLGEQWSAKEMAIDLINRGREALDSASLHELSEVRARILELETELVQLNRLIRGD